MLRILTKIDAADYADSEVQQLLDGYFEPELIARGERTSEVEILHGVYSAGQWARRMKEGCPENLGLALFHIAKRGEYTMPANLGGRVAQQWVWPFFFEKFPLGQIWIIDADMDWLRQMWAGHRAIAACAGYRPEDPVACPQEFSGLLSDTLPHSVLVLAAFGVYPLAICSFSFTSSGLIFMYIPDRAFVHSQMTEGNTLHQEVMYSLSDLYDDGLSDTSRRGPKSGADPVNLNPLHCLEYLDWIISQLAERMQDLLNVQDAMDREQMAMTANRVVCDALLCSVVELPYMSKTLFFACLDKLANLMNKVGAVTAGGETDIWKLLVSPEFLRSEVVPVMRAIGGHMGEELVSTVEWVCEDVLDHMSADELYMLRNSSHGYFLRGEQWQELMTRSGDVRNDLTLLATPLALWALAQPWHVT
jgi:hypothetical protein